MPQKVLVVGPVNGRLTELVSKVSAIQSKHGPFAALFILGDLLHPSPSKTLLQQQTDLLGGQIQLPIPTYFYQGTSALPPLLSAKIAHAAKTSAKDVPSGLVRVVDNLYFAEGKSGVFVTADGLRVAFLGGKWDAKRYAEDAPSKEFDPEEWYETNEQRAADEAVSHITPATAHRLLAHPSLRLPFLSATAPKSLSGATSASAKPGTLAAARASASQDSARTAAQTAALQLLTSRPPLDLLLTNCWPTGITLFSAPPNPADPTGGLPDPTARMWGSPALARLASHACPRYHFSLAPSTDDADLPVGIQDETLQMGAFWERAPYVTELSAYLPVPLGQATPQQRREAEQLKSVTRFVSLAKFANAKKRRWFLALNLTPADEQKEPVAVPANATQTPYFVPSSSGAEAGNAKRAANLQGAVDMDAGPNFRFSEPRAKRQRGEGANDEVPPPGYVCRICNVEGHYIRACPSKQQPSSSSTNAAASTGSNSLLLPNPSIDPSSSTAAETKNGWSRSTIPLPPGLPAKPAFASANSAPRRQMIPVGPSNCWFCLSNPSVAKSLIVTIGAESYLVFPKGGFVHPDVNGGVKAGHLLIVPLAHVSHLLPPGHPVLGPAGGDESEAEAEERARVRGEMEATKATVRDMWAESECGMLEWTLVRVRTSSRMTHLQTQLLALSNAVVEQANLVQQLDDALEAQHPASNSRGVLRTTDDIAAYFNSSSSTRTEKGEEEDGYFHMALHLSETLGGKREWLVPLSTTTRFQVQFVRSTLARLLNVPHLADWKTASQQDDTDNDADKEKQRSADFRALLLARTA